MIDAPDDPRLALAAVLRPGDPLELAIGGGGLVDVRIERIDGVDLLVHGEVAPAAVGSLVAARLHDGVTAWFCTFVVLGGDARSDGGATLDLRLGAADRVTSERWSERAPLVCPALVRAEGSGATLRAVALDASAIGVGLLLREGDLTAGSLVDVALTGLSGGAIRFRGLVRRRTWAAEGRLLGVEIVDLSAEDRARLERALGAHR